jgi:hypothetical protein
VESNTNPIIPIELSLSPVTVAELVHGIYRAKTLGGARRRREYIEELLGLIPVHPVTSQTAWMVGRLDGEEAAKGNVLPFNDLMIAAAALEQDYCGPDGQSAALPEDPWIDCSSPRFAGWLARHFWGVAA